MVCFAFQIQPIVNDSYFPEHISGFILIRSCPATCLKLWAKQLNSQGRRRTPFLSLLGIKSSIIHHPQQQKLHCLVRFSTQKGKKSRAENASFSQLTALILPNLYSWFIFQVYQIGKACAPVQFMRQKKNYRDIPVFFDTMYYENSESCKSQRYPPSVWHGAFPCPRPLISNDHGRPSVVLCPWVSRPPRGALRTRCTDRGSTAHLRHQCALPPAKGQDGTGGTHKTCCLFTFERLLHSDSHPPPIISDIILLNCGLCVPSLRSFDS